VTRAGSGDGRHSRSKLREKEERRWDRENERESASSGQRDKLVKMDDGAVTVDFKNAGAEVKSLGTKIKRAHKKAVRKLTKKVDAAVSGLTNGGNKPATFRANRTSAQPSGYYGRAGAGYAAPPPWIGGLLGWGALFAAAWAITKVFGLGGGVRNASGTFRLPSFGGGGGRRKRPKGSGPGRWVTDRSLGGREVWVEDKYSGRGARGNALAEDLAYVDPLRSEAATKAKAREEAKAAKAAAAASEMVEPQVVVAAVAGVLPSRATRPSPASGQGAAGDAVLQARGRRRVHRRGHRGPEGRLRVRERVRGGVRQALQRRDGHLQSRRGVCARRVRAEERRGDGGRAPDVSVGAQRGRRGEAR
jgi:hypothetical protein